MAFRPVFIIKERAPRFEAVMTEFEFHSGFSAVQRGRSAKSLAAAFEADRTLRGLPYLKVLEVSSASDEKLGVALSAFNLMITQKNGVTYSVESAFQASKCFERGGPYKDLLLKPSREAKKDERLRTSGAVTGFSISGLEFPTVPRTYFYDWLYVNALSRHPEYHDELMTYGAFTDISFNPQKQINCQAEAVTIFVSLKRAGLLDEALTDKDRFLEVVFEGRGSNGLHHL